MNILTNEDLEKISGGLTEENKDFAAGAVCAAGIIIGSIISGGLFAAALISIGIHSCAYGLMRNIYI